MTYDPGGHAAHTGTRGGALGGTRGGTRGLTIGRFNIVHITHEDRFKHLLDISDEVIVGLGSAQYGHGNPKPGEYAVKHCLSLDERIELVTGCIADINYRRLPIRVVPIEDTPSDEDWGRSVLEKAGRFDLILTEKPLERELFAPHATIVAWPYQSMIRNGIVIDHILSGDDYRHLVPAYCAGFLERIGIRSRMRELHDIDIQLFGAAMGAPHAPATQPSGDRGMTATPEIDDSPARSQYDNDNEIENHDVTRT